MSYEPITDDEAVDQIAIGMHTGLRKGSEAPDSAKLWRAISDSTDSSWSDAAKFTVFCLKSMGYAICREDRRERFDEALDWTLTEHAETLRRLGEGQP